MLPAFCLRLPAFCLRLPAFCRRLLFIVKKKLNFACVLPEFVKVYKCFASILQALLAFCRRYAGVFPAFQLSKGREIRIQ